MNWRSYENGLLEKIRHDFPPPLFLVQGTSAEGKQHRVVGRHSLTTRQLDAAVYRSGADLPFLIADAKCRTRPITVPEVEAFIGMMEDVGADIGILAACDFASTARRRADASRVRVMVMTLEDALTFQYYPLAREVYPFDWAFHPLLARALREIELGSPAGMVADVLEEILFEEWEAFVEFALVKHPQEAVSFLVWIVSNHRDEGWRFNSARLLLENGLLSAELRARLLNTPDPDLQELLADSTVAD